MHSKKNSTSKIVLEHCLFGESFSSKKKSKRKRENLSNFNIYTDPPVPSQGGRGSLWRERGASGYRGVRLAIDYSRRGLPLVPAARSLRFPFVEHLSTWKDIKLVTAVPFSLRSPGPPPELSPPLSPASWAFLAFAAHPVLPSAPVSSLPPPVLRLRSRSRSRLAPTPWSVPYIPSHRGHDRSGNFCPEYVIAERST